MRRWPACGVVAYVNGLMQEGHHLQRGGSPLEGIGLVIASSARPSSLELSISPSLGTPSESWAIGPVPVLSWSRPHDQPLGERESPMVGDFLIKLYREIE
jgi:hypothetical protein